MSNTEVEGIVHDEFNRMRGKLCGLIESWGLDQKQERGAINTLKSLSYDAEQVITDVVVEE